jgi:hypothetical protein
LLLPRATIAMASTTASSQPTDIAKRMAVSKNAADDMMRVLSIYDTGVLPVSPPAAGEAAGEAYGSDEEEAFAAAEDVILRCNSSSSSSGMNDYLYAVDDAIAAAALQGGLASRAAEAVQAATGDSIDCGAARAPSSAVGSSRSAWPDRTPYRHSATTS